MQSNQRMFAMRNRMKTKISNKYIFVIALVVAFISINTFANNSAFSAKDKASKQAPMIGKLYWVGGNQLSRSNLDGGRFQVLIKDLDAPDGLVVNLASQTVTWTNMSNGPNGSLQRSNLHGKRLSGDGEFLVAPASFETGKEIELDPSTNKLYWADRDGKKVLRSNSDGSELEVFVDQFVDADGKTIALENPVGIALDLENRHLYFTDRFMARVMRAPLDVKGSTVRSDVSTLIKGDLETSRPIDIDLDIENQLMYWTDRGEHTVNVSNFDGSNHVVLINPDTLDIRDPIGITLELAKGTMVWTDMTTHKIYRNQLDGSQIQVLLEGEQLLDGLRYGPLGIVSKTIEPESGSAKGGEAVYVVGDNFVPGSTRVALGKNASTLVEVVDSNLLRFIAPAGQGLADLHIETPNGKATYKKAYRYR